MTLAQLEALEDRRAIAIRHARFNAALVASTIFNANRTTSEVPPLSPFDFLAGFEADPEEQRKAELRRSVKQAVALAFTQLPKTITREQALAEKAKMIANMQRTGFEDAEEIFREVFPDL